MNHNSVKTGSVAHDGTVPQPRLTQPGTLYPDFIAVHMEGRDGTRVPIGAVYKGDIGGGVQAYALMTDGSGGGGEIPPAVDNHLVQMTDPVNGHTILLQYDLTAVPPALLSAFDISANAEYTGALEDLEPVAGSSLESDPVPVCYDGENLRQWVIKKDGTPTGAVTYTNLAGTIVAVTNPLLLSEGTCAVSSNQSVSSATGDDLSSLLPGNSFGVIKPDCCGVTIQTSIGDFTIPEKVTSYSTDRFSTPFAVTGVVLSPGGLCSESEITIISNQF